MKARLTAKPPVISETGLWMQVARIASATPRIISHVVVCFEVASIPIAQLPDVWMMGPEIGSRVTGPEGLSSRIADSQFAVLGLPRVAAQVILVLIGLGSGSTVLGRNNSHQRRPERRE